MSEEKLDQKKMLKELKERKKVINEMLKRRNKEKGEECIQIPDLKPGYLYKIHARNARFGIWIPQRSGFLISRVKFYDNFLFEELHWNASDWHGTARPLEELEQSPFSAEDLNMMEHQREDGDLYLDYRDSEDVLEYLNSFEENDPERQRLLNVSDAERDKYAALKKKMRKIVDEDEEEGDGEIFIYSLL